MIRFAQLGHRYSSIDESNPIDWVGVSSLVSFFKPSFDPVAGALKASRNPRSKWFKMDPQTIQNIWKGESERSTDMGTWYHDKTEQSITAGTSFSENEHSFNVVKPIMINDQKIASDQKLVEGHIYPEHLMYLQSEGLCGQTDRVEVTGGLINIRDYKTSKTIKEEGFRNWEGITQRMRDPLSHLDECNLVHYTLQMTLYMYMALKHNPQLRPGSLTIDHIIFEIDHEDQYGYPVYKKDSSGEFIIKEIKPYKVPYLKMEAMAMLAVLRENRDLIKSKSND